MTHKFFLCSARDSNLWSWNPLDLEADALPIEPPRPPLGDNDMICCSTSEYVGVVWQTGSGTGLGIETFQVQNLSLAVSNLVPISLV